MADVFSLLFQRELSLESSPDIPAFLEQLRNGQFTDYRQVYEAYLRLTEQLESAASLKPNTVWFRIWEKIKAVLKRARPAAVALLVAALAIYLIYSIMYPAPAQNEAYDFQRIGTVEIRDSEGGTEG